MKCETCGRLFPSELIIFGSCPLCALAYRNAVHGLPPGTPFNERQAKKMVDDAKAWIARSNKADK